mgnify:CR=1 FL=1
MFRHRRGRVLLGVLGVLIVPALGWVARGDERLKGIACRSVHLVYPGAKGTAFYNEVTIRKSAVGTYFMVCGWNKGYFGLQELGNGRKLLIFSVWDSNQNDPKAVEEDRRTKLLYKDEQVRVGRFGGEGTGGQSFFDYDWKVGETYRLMVSARIDGDRTAYTGWFFVPETQQWKRLVTFSTVTGGADLGGYYAFIEDFKRDKVSTTHARQAEFGGAWIRTVAGAAEPVVKARFSADANPVLNINAHVEGDRFVLATGGDVANTGAKLKETMTLARAEAEKRTPPDALELSAAEPIDSAKLLRGPWDEGEVLGESVLFMKGKEGAPRARLLYDVDKLTAVRGADGRTTFEAGRDFRPLEDGSGLELTADSRIPFLSETDLFRPKGSPISIGHKAGDPETSVLFDNGHFFHDHQVEVSYAPRASKWDAYRPAFAGDRLPRTLAKLRAKEPITLVVSGDSISEGYNASKFTRTPPFQPAYPELVAMQLERSYGSKVALHNLAVAGWSAARGAEDLDKALRLKPDLIVIAYGMNDVNGRNPEAFQGVIKGMLDRIKRADAATEVVLVATMTGNPDWFATPDAMFPAYRDALKALEGPGVVLADLTAVWRRLLERKRLHDLTGNGVNHPNDYGHRVYAQTILGLLVESR